MTKPGLLAKLSFSLLLLLCMQVAFAQSRTIKGTVTDEKNAPLAGASVTIAGTAGGTSTDASGAFTLSVPSSATTITIQYVGYESQQVSIKDVTTVTVQLQLSKTSLDAIVVVGYGTQKKKDLTGAVASVKGDDIKSLPVTNVQEALQGRMAGVEVIKSSGAPDATANIIIRGVSSLNNGAPLYIVDGVRQSGDNINIQDIASVDVLKDASAASIYGSAAAGGVIIITTKKGQVGKPTINFSARYGVTKPRILQLLDRNDFIKMKRYINPTYLNNVNTDTLPNTNWTDEIFRDATEQNYNLSVSGASPNVNYLVSGVYNNQKGVFLDNKSSLAGMRVNTEYKLGNYVKFGEQLYVWQRNTNPVMITPINPPFRSVPIMPVYDNTDPSSPWGKNPAGFAGPNLVAQIKTAHVDNKKSNFQGNAFAEIKLPFYLSFRTTFGYTYYTEDQNYFQDVYNTGAVSAPINSLTKFNSSTKTLLYNYVLTFDHTFGKHAVNALAGYEQFRSNYNAINAKMTSVGGNSYAFIPTSTSTSTITPGGYDPNGLVKSTFGRLNYNYDGKYFLSGSIRRDGNFTVFGPGNQYGVFPSASAGWRISEEPFLRNSLPQVSQLKLRASYGVLGNSNIPSYLFLSTYDYINAQNFAPGAPPAIGYSQTFIPNPNIKWESVYETNIGLDAELFNGKFFFTVEWYNKKTKDMLYALPIPTSVGIPSNFYTNIGSVQNRGVDILAGYRDHVDKLNYSVSFSGSFNKNKVLNLDNINTNPILAGDNNYGNPTFGIMTGQPLAITKAGQPFGMFYGYKVEGIYKTDEEVAKHPQQEGYTAHPGDLIFSDVTPDGVINDKDKTIIGNPNPKFTYGVNINLNWKGFDLAMLFNGAAGVDIFNGVAPYAQFPFSDGNTTSKVFGASYLGNNQLTSQPRIGILNNLPGGGTSFTVDPNHNYSWASSYFVENGSYLKLKNLQLGYNFSGKILDKAHIKNARIYLMANNLFTITKYSGIDPELGGGVTNRGIDAPWQYPHTRIYSMGIDLTL
ncbi:MAG: TonB-dependent receptor [Chitinophagaceae bacterium]